MGTKKISLGCGNSELAFQIADHGYKTIVNVDYAENVIEHMKTVTQEKQTKENKDYSDMSWYAADCMNDLATQLPPQKNYGIIIDKSLVDTIACGDDDQQTRVKSLAKELLSVAKPNAVWCSISFSSEREFYVDDYQGNSYWRTEEKIPIEVHQPNDKPGAPAIYYYIYINRKVQSSSLS